MRALVTGGGGFLRLYIVEQLLDAVAFAHEQQVIHCDIKPENVIMFDDGHVRLADFGIAKVARETLRACGTGTIGYMAPEQAMGRPSCRSDVFSLGLLFYRMMSGEWPEWPFTWPLAGYQKLQGRLDPRLISWLRKAIEIRPELRFADATQMRNSFLKLRSSAFRFAEEQRNRRRATRSDTARTRGRTGVAGTRRRELRRDGPGGCRAAGQGAAGWRGRGRYPAFSLGTHRAG